jgi:ferredoxin-NADP reductase
MLRYIAEEELPHRVTLVYSNRDQDSAAFLDELSALERDNPNLRLVLTMTDDPAWKGETRRIDADFLRAHLDDDLGAFTYLVAGPPAMVEAMEKTLRDAGIPEEQIRPERFSGY